MLLELIKALCSVGAVTGLASFVLFYWTLRAEDQHLAEAFGLAAHPASTSSPTQHAHWARIENVQQSGLYRTQNALLHKHWVEYGGGFYGLIAVLTLLWMEVNEILDFITTQDSLTQLLQKDIVGTAIQLMINAIMNTAMAFAWPAYWLAEIHSRYIWVWFVAAWLGYVGGKRLAAWRCGHAQS